MRSLLILALAAGLASPALAGQPVYLKADTFDADGVVTLGDLFDGAGPAGRVALANRAGPSLILDAAAVQLAARRAGLDWANAEGLRKIVVHGGLVSASSAGAQGNPAAAAVRGNVDVLTYARSLSVGEIVQPSDLIWAKAAGAPDDAPSDADAVIGKAAKRPLRSGATVSARDVGAAMVIKAGDTITVTYDYDGVSLSLQGKAMGSAGVGETISVLNPASKKVLQAVVTGAGEAAVGPTADALKAARSTRYAVR
jgi:flagella basal body P-ring formation protein FlgA